MVSCNASLATSLFYSAVLSFNLLYLCQDFLNQIRSCSHSAVSSNPLFAQSQLVCQTKSAQEDWRLLLQSVSCLVASSANFSAFQFDKSNLCSLSCQAFLESSTSLLNFRISLCRSLQSNACLLSLCRYQAKIPFQQVRSR